MIAKTVELSNEEIMQCFRKIKDGDKESRSFIIQNNIPLVLLITKKFLSSGIEVEELVSTGMIGLINAVDNYNIDMNFKFSTYASKCIENEILMYLRKNQKNLKNISLETKYIINSTKEEVKLIDTLQDENADVEKDYDNYETNLVIQEILNTLDERERKIIELYFGFNIEEPYTQEEIAKEVNLTQSYVAKLIKKTLHKIKTSPKSKKLILTLYN